LKSLLSLKKNYKHDLKDKIESHKIFEKKARDKNKKFKVEGPNKKPLYIQIKNQELNCKKNLYKRKNKKNTEIKTKMTKSKILVTMRTIEYLSR
jgi:hypothetical protein